MEKQNQRTEENSTSIQAGRDVNIGLGYTDVKSICFDLFKQNFPELVKQAADEALKNVEKFVNLLESKLRSQLSLDTIQQFAKPEIQYLLNETIKSSARYGDKSNQEILTDLLINRLSTREMRDIDLIIDKAIEVVPSLTHEQIKIITLQFYINTITKSDATKEIDVEMLSIVLLSLCNIDNKMAVKQRQLLMLSALGLCSMNTIISVDPFDVIIKRYPFLKVSNITKENIGTLMPATSKLIELYSHFNLGMFTFNSVASSIAIITMKGIIKDLEIERLLQ